MPLGVAFSNTQAHDYHHLVEDSNNKSWEIGCMNDTDMQRDIVPLLYLHCMHTCICVYVEPSLILLTLFKVRNLN